MGKEFDKLNSKYLQVLKSVCRQGGQFLSCLVPLWVVVVSQWQEWGVRIVLEPARQFVIDISRKFAKLVLCQFGKLHLWKYGLQRDGFTLKTRTQI